MQEAPPACVSDSGASDGPTTTPPARADNVMMQLPAWKSVEGARQQQLTPQTTAAPSPASPPMVGASGRPRSPISPSVFKHPTGPLALAAHTKYLFSTTRNAGASGSSSGGSSSRSNSWAFLDGVRVFSMFWIFFSHVSMLWIGYATWDILPGLQKHLSPTSPWMLLISGGQFPVDTFFFLSAFFLGLRGWPLLQKDACLARRCAAVVLVTLRRFLRIWPAMLALILCSPLFLRFPVHNERQALMVERVIGQMQCEKYWWKPLLMMNNVFPKMEHCAGWTWYISNDTQFFLGALALMAGCAGLQPVARRRHVLEKWLWGTGMLCGVYAAYTCYVSDWLFLGNYGFAAQPKQKVFNMLLLDYMQHDTGLWTYFNNYYTYPWNRVFPYLVGLGFGIRVAEASMEQQQRQRREAEALGGAVAGSDSYSGMTTRAPTRRAADDFCCYGGDDTGQALQAAQSMHEFRQRLVAHEEDDDRFAAAAAAMASQQQERLAVTTATGGRRGSARGRRGSYVPPSVAADSLLWIAVGMASCVMAPVLLRNEQRLLRTVYTVGSKLLWSWLMCLLCRKGKQLAALEQQLQSALGAEVVLTMPLQLHLQQQQQQQPSVGKIQLAAYRFLASPKWLPLTRISYGFYLCHVAVVTPMLYLLMLHPEFYNPFNSGLCCAVFLASLPATILVACAQYVLIETPARLAGDALLKRCQTPAAKEKKQD